MIKKRLKQTFLLLIIIALSISLYACSDANGKNKEDPIHINGDVSVILEVNHEYIEKGVTYPTDQYTLVTQGEVDNSVLGTYELKYSVFSNDGELAKEMHRFVNVVDTTAPTYVKNNKNDYYVGINYSLSDFISSYSDNYCANNAIQVSQNSFVFSEAGQNSVEIILTDTSQNKAVFSRNINVIMDMGVILEDRYASTYITRGTTGIGTEYMTVSIDYDSRFTYYIGSTSHYICKGYTSLGKSASIQISAKYGEFNRADVDYNINGYYGDYSVGFATIDATKKTATITSFSSTINNLNLNVNDMLEELNNQISGALNAFHDYMNNRLRLDVK